MPTEPNSPSASHRRRRIAVSVVTVIGVFATLAGVAPPQATATYPGADGRIAFVRSNQVYTVNPDGSGLTQLTSVAKNYRPRWSPSGNRIAYVHETAGGSTDVWVMRSDGSRKQRVTRLGDVNAAASWSPNGRLLAFAGGPNQSLRRISSRAPFGRPTVLRGYETGCWDCPNDDSGGRHPLPVDRFLAWSPDGSRIALFNHDDARLDDAIYMYNLATGEAHQTMAIGGDCCGNADWSNLTWGPAGQFGYATVVYDDVTGEPEPSRVVYPHYVGKPGDTGPAPAPANRRIAVTNAESGTAKIFVQTVRGTGRRVLTAGYQPDWQPRP